MKMNNNIQRDDPLTWGDDNWPSREGNRTSVGFFEVPDDYSLKQAWENRQNPTIVQIFRNILGILVLLTFRLSIVQF